MTDGAFDVRWRGIDGVAWKLSFEPTCSGHIRIEYEWTGARWREVGRELETMELVDTWIDSRGRDGRVKQIETAFEPRWVQAAMVKYALGSEVLVADDVAGGDDDDGGVDSGDGTGDETTDGDGADDETA